MPARVALLRRLAPHPLPHPTHLAVADVPILLLEAAGAAALLGVTGAWWAPPGALAALLAARLGAGACGRPRRELHGITTGFSVREWGRVAISRRVVDGPDGFGLTHVGLVACADLPRRCRPSPSRTAGVT
jgi:hypothetical protein